MNRIINIGMDVHSTNYTLCGFTMAGQRPFAQSTINPDLKELDKYLTTLNQELGGGCEFLCGYEAGCLGYSLYHQIRNHKWKGFKVDCIILAPSTMPASQKERVKTDKRDALKNAKCLPYSTYSAVYVPTDEDNTPVKKANGPVQAFLPTIIYTNTGFAAAPCPAGGDGGGRRICTKPTISLRLTEIMFRDDTNQFCNSFQVFCRGRACSARRTWIERVEQARPLCNDANETLYCCILRQKLISLSAVGLPLRPLLLLGIIQKRSICKRRRQSWR